MNEADLKIYGYLEKGSDTALCTLCAQIIYAYSLNTALGAGILEIIRLHWVEHLHDVLMCVRCGEVILEPTKPAKDRLEPFRKYVESEDLGAEL